MKKRPCTVIKLVLFLHPLFFGCTTTSNNFHETLREFDAKGNITSETATKGKSTANVAMMLKAKELAQDWVYEWEGNHIAFGQNALDYDSTSQAEFATSAVYSLAPLLERLVESFVESLIAELLKPPVIAFPEIPP